MLYVIYESNFPLIETKLFSYYIKGQSNIFRKEKVIFLSFFLEIVNSNAITFLQLQITNHLFHDFCIIVLTNMAVYMTVHSPFSSTIPPNIWPLFAKIRTIIAKKISIVYYRFWIRCTSWFNVDLGLLKIIWVGIFSYF